MTYFKHWFSVGVLLYYLVVGLGAAKLTLYIFPRTVALLLLLLMLPLLYEVSFACGIGSLGLLLKLGWVSPHILVVLFDKLTSFPLASQPFWGLAEDYNLSEALNDLLYEYNLSLSEVLKEQNPYDVT